MPQKFLSYTLTDYKPKVINTDADAGFVNIYISYLCLVEL